MVTEYQKSQTPQAVTNKHSPLTPLFCTCGKQSSQARNEHPLGPPHQLDDLARKSNLYHRKDTFGSSIEFGVERISNSPHMFLLSNYVSDAERFTLQWSARNDPKDAHEYVGKQASNRKDSFVSWLNPDDAHGISKSLAKSAASLLFSVAMREGKDGAGLYEQLQVVRYKKNGIFDFHHDSDEHGRVVTVLYYLNGVAGTWFPLASGTPSAPDHSRTSPQTEKIARDLIRRNDLSPGTDGILVAGSEEYPQSTDTNHVVRIKSGDALVFYNYDSSNTGVYNFEERMTEPSGFPTLDWRSIHAALPASEHKCIATHWFHGGKALTGISNL